MLSTKHRKLGFLLTSPRGGPGQDRCNGDVANKTTQEHSAALPTTCWALPASTTCKKLLCNRRCLMLAGSNALEKATRCTPASEMGSIPGPVPQILLSASAHCGKPVPRPRAVAFRSSRNSPPSCCPAGLECSVLLTPSPPDSSAEALCAAPRSRGMA